MTYQLRRVIDDCPETDSDGDREGGIVVGVREIQGRRECLKTLTLIVSSACSTVHCVVRAETAGYTSLSPVPDLQRYR